MNGSEIHVATLYRNAGWKMLRNGWPDYLATRTVAGRFEARGVEVKGPSDDLRFEQKEMHEALARSGMAVDVVKVDAAGDVNGFGLVTKWERPRSKRWRSPEQIAASMKKALATRARNKAAATEAARLAGELPAARLRQMEDELYKLRSQLHNLTRARTALLAQVDSQKQAVRA